MTERVIAPERLDFIDVVTSSHNHTDHLDAETLSPLLRANPAMTLVFPRPIARSSRTGCASTPRPGRTRRRESVTVGTFTFTALPPRTKRSARTISATSCRRAVDDLPQRRHAALSRHGRATASVSDRRRSSADQWQQARAPRRRKSRRTRSRAARARHRRAGRMPCHYEMFEFNTASPDEFVQTCAQLGQRCHVLQSGEAPRQSPFRERRIRSRKTARARGKRGSRPRLSSAAPAPLPAADRPHRLWRNRGSSPRGVSTLRVRCCRALWTGGDEAARATGKVFSRPQKSSPITASFSSRRDIEVVDIATHPDVRAPIIKAALDAGKHVLSQKPFALDLASGERLVKLAEGVACSWPSIRTVAGHLISATCGRPFRAG